MYDYFLGGQDNFEADRVAAEAAIRAFPRTAESARASRAFLRRAVLFLAAEAGIRQFLDIGTGLPSGQNVHEVAQSAAPEAKIVYVDNDPIVLAPAQTLLTSTPGDPRWGSTGLNREARSPGLGAFSRRDPTAFPNVPTATTKIIQICAAPARYLGRPIFGQCESGRPTRSWVPAGPSSRFRRATAPRCGLGRRAARRSVRPGP